ncbi:uncharacterized protein C8A04DRAFT_32475 [Dichotomopilus funicola]|uniref:Uncharacterized protein n=1 Tax=Dichotomopilus funicola TaxID=1934379 RepID=A0AAN6UVQ2_9PEZI|nr:hypothetical protein C8A04DRAFT_32475 [Dichotomopilus funicola]
MPYAPPGWPNAAGRPRYESANRERREREHDWVEVLDEVDDTHATLDARQDQIRGGSGPRYGPGDRYPRYAGTLSRRRDTHNRGRTEHSLDRIRILDPDRDLDLNRGRVSDWERDLHRYSEQYEAINPNSSNSGVPGRNVIYNFGPVTFQNCNCAYGPRPWHIHGPFGPRPSRGPGPNPGAGYDLGHDPGYDPGPGPGYSPSPGLGPDFRPRSGPGWGPDPGLGPDPARVDPFSRYSPSSPATPVTPTAPESRTSSHSSDSSMFEPIPPRWSNSGDGSETPSIYDHDNAASDESDGIGAINSGLAGTHFYDHPVPATSRTPVPPYPVQPKSILRNRYPRPPTGVGVSSEDERQQRKREKERIEREKERDRAERHDTHRTKSRSRSRNRSRSRSRSRSRDKTKSRKSSSRQAGDTDGEAATHRTHMCKVCLLRRPISRYSDYCAPCEEIVRAPNLGAASASRVRPIPELRQEGSFVRQSSTHRRRNGSPGASLRYETGTRRGGGGDGGGAQSGGGGRKEGGRKGGGRKKGGERKLSHDLLEKNDRELRELEESEALDERRREAVERLDQNIARLKDIDRRLGQWRMRQPWAEQT